MEKLLIEKVRAQKALLEAFVNNAKLIAAMEPENAEIIKHELAEVTKLVEKIDREGFGINSVSITITNPDAFDKAVAKIGGLQITSKRKTSEADSVYTLEVKDPAALFYLGREFQKTAKTAKK